MNQVFKYGGQKHWAFVPHPTVRKSQFCNFQKISITSCLPKKICTICLYLVHCVLSCWLRMPRIASKNVHLLWQSIYIAAPRKYYHNKSCFVKNINWKGLKNNYKYIIKSELYISSFCVVDWEIEESWIFKNKKT